MHKFTIKEIEKAMDYLRKECAAELVSLEVDHQGVLILSGVSIGGDAVTIKIYNDQVNSFAKVTKTERL